MSRMNLRSIVAALVLAAAFVLALPSGSEASPVSGHLGPVGWDQVWRSLLKSLWGDTGMASDPNGRVDSPPPTAPPPVSIFSVPGLPAPSQTTSATGQSSAASRVPAPAGDRRAPHVRPAHR